MAKKIEVEYIEHPNEGARIRRLAEIVGEGVYANLKERRLLRGDPQLKERARDLIEKTREFTHQNENLGEGVIG